MSVKLTAPQRELLHLMGDGPREGITDKRVANALGLKGLVSYDAADDAWSITDAGRALLPRPLQQEEKTP